MKYIKKIIVPLLLCLSQMAVGIAVYDKLPSEMPTHYNFQGVVDAYGSKNFVLFGMPLIFAALIITMPFLMKLDPKYNKSNRIVEELSLMILAVVSCVINYAAILIALGMKLDINVLLTGIIGLMFVVIGNYLPKTNQSYMIGIKLPWTLNSEENWKRTHRFSGFLWVVVGFAMLLNIFIKSFLVMEISIGLAILLPVIYSLILFRKGI